MSIYIYMNICGKSNQSVCNLQYFVHFFSALLFFLCNCCYLVYFCFSGTPLLISEMTREQKKKITEINNKKRQKCALNIEPEKKRRTRTSLYLARLK